MEPICPHSIQAFLDEADSSTGVSDPDSSHHVTLQASAPGSQGCPTIGPQSRESFSKVWLPVCRREVLLAKSGTPYLFLETKSHSSSFSLAHSSTPLPITWDTEGLEAKSHFPQGKERMLSRWWMGQRSWRGPGSKPWLFYECAGLGLKLGLSLREGAAQMPDGIYFV